MATTYSELKTEIAAFTHRADLSSYLDTFIDFAEARLNRELRVSQQETRLTQAASSEYITLPSDFLAIRVVHLITNPIQELQYITPAEMDRIDDGGDTLNYYTMLGDTLQLQSTSGYDVEITYYAKISALSDSNTTNWMLAAHPDVYLYACLIEAFNYAMDEEQVSKYNLLYENAKRSIKSLDFERRSGNSMRVRAA